MGKKVLIVEDSATVRRMLEDEFRKGGWSVVSCTNCWDGVERLQKEEFNLVVSDIRTPKLNGLIFTSIIKNSSISELPVILYSIADTPSVHYKLAKCGADYFIPKTQKPSAVLRVAEEVVDESKKYKFPEKEEPFETIFNIVEDGFLKKWVLEDLYKQVVENYDAPHLFLSSLYRLFSKIVEGVVGVYLAFLHEEEVIQEVYLGSSLSTKKKEELNKRIAERVEKVFKRTSGRGRKTGENEEDFFFLQAVLRQRNKKTGLLGVVLISENWTEKFEENAVEYLLHKSLEALKILRGTER